MAGPLVLEEDGHNRHYNLEPVDIQLQLGIGRPSSRKVGTTWHIR
jgi:hypothetical protein